MGWYFRKSLNFGPFRVNLSKSGIGFSTGVRGARVSTGPRGTYIHLGSHGVYYRERLDTNQRKPQSASTIFGQSSEANSNPKVENFGAGDLIDSSKESTVEKLNSCINKIRFTPLSATFITVMLIALFALIIAIANTPGYVLSDTEQVGLFFLTVLLVAFGIVFVWQVHRYDEFRRTMSLTYEMDESGAKYFRRISQACEALSHTNQAWCMSYAARHWNNAQVIKKLPPHIETNVDVWSVISPGFMLSFLPDQLLIWTNGKYESIDYKNIYFNYQPSPLTVIHGSPPSDAEIVSKIWLHSRKDGGPDLRYKYNPLFPIVRYGQIALSNRTGAIIYLQTSSPQAAMNFCALIIDEKHRVHTRAKSERQNQKSSEKFKKPGAEKSAYEILQVDENASKEEITAAYRNLVKMNHPDKVASLAPEFRELAEQRMKVINAAYQTLIKRTK
jgi:hypothetical protein